ncbi:hypothetical protein GCM10011506_08840 [Marivirga lumbricoides]|uniref:Secretion system C-terminal sorting domain-containing protein n=1 Tax=Marivirga lumbricoides TaxID=1046115 RepID=A0ABQ1LLX0_9BACT|nr:hypothetical protein GCM10011506_08840 [Marivirga lumbricoides]
MKFKTLTLFLLLVATSRLLSQISYEPIPGSSSETLPPFTAVSYSSVAWADVDSDGDQDVLITGLGADNNASASLYLNDGNGNFAQVKNTSFEGVAFSSIAFADVDGDGDPDVLITGRNVNKVPLATLYKNDGLGNFSKVENTPFGGVYHSSIAFADIDGDKDQDLLISGTNDISNTSILYSNDGEGNYTIADDSFPGLVYSSVAFDDLDGDNDADLILTGADYSTGQYIPNTIVYTNDGKGTFNELLNSGLHNFAHSSLAIADVDGDDDLDVFISGQNLNQSIYSFLYLNDGNAKFTHVTTNSFIGVIDPSIALADIDLDDDVDLIISGTDTDNITHQLLYTNDGSGNFTIVNNTPFASVGNSSIAFADIDGDNYPDLLSTGSHGLTEPPSAVLYRNTGKGIFKRVIGSYFAGTSSSEANFVDVNGDGHQDVFTSGYNSQLGYEEFSSMLYFADGDGNFTANSSNDIKGLIRPSSAWGDVDGDGDMDLFISGEGDFSSAFTALYINDGKGNFTAAKNTSFEQVRYSSLDLADIDGDKDLDLIVTGMNSSFQPSTTLYTNDGAGSFNRVQLTTLENVQFSAAAFADIDNDQDNDLLISGLNINQKPITRLYTNDGKGVFTEQESAGLEGLVLSSVAFADIDGDLDIDLLISGDNRNSKCKATLYKNDGAGHFTKVENTPFIGVQLGSIKFVDVDGDADQDVLIAGMDYDELAVTELYANDGQGNFTKMENTQLEVVKNPSIASADIDGDKIPELLITGLSKRGSVAILYRSINSPTPCGAPIADAENLPTLMGVCQIEMPEAPTATNGCGNIITGVADIQFPITDASIKEVTWTFANGSGAPSSQTQAVKLAGLSASITSDNGTLSVDVDNAIYQWLDCSNNMTIIDGETNQTFQPVKAGSYAVKVTVDGCSVISECEEIVVTSIVENTFSGEASIAPNPTQGRFKIILDKPYPLTMVTVYNANGQVVSQKQFSFQKQEMLNLEQPSGLYLVKISNGEEHALIRVVKE